MKILFHPAHDGNAWPGVVASARRAAVFGEAWLGPAGLLGFLETQLGLAGPRNSDALRAASLVPRLAEVDGFWSASAAIDPFGVAETLLSWRDELCLSGWRGEAAAPRLRQLADLTSDLADGAPDRLQAVVATLERRRGIDIESLKLCEPEETLPVAWQSVISALRVVGVTVGFAPSKPAPASGDLGSARAAGAAPRGDHSLLLVRPAGPMEAAESVAAWLAAQSDLTDTVVIAPDDCFDSALHRYGLPATGAPAAHGDSLGQLLPLVVGLAESPPDPVRVLELLQLPISPVPQAIARKLARALTQWPAVDSDAWCLALDSGLAEVEDEDRRKRLGKRLSVLFETGASGGSGSSAAVDGVSTLAITDRVDLLATWLRGREDLAQSHPPSWSRALTDCRDLSAVLEACGMETMPISQVRRLLRRLRIATGAEAQQPAQAGLASIDTPAAMLGPARRVLWWNFSRDRAPRASTLPLTIEERSALQEAGVALPSLHRAAQLQAERWRRPLLQTTQQLCLVCPRLNESGEEMHPHPLWDELVANLADKSMAHRWVASSPLGGSIPPQPQRMLLPLPSPRTCWKVPSNTVARRERESPSSAGRLIACSFSWALQYVGRIAEGAVLELPTGSRLHGSLAHHILECVFANDASPDPAAAEQQSRELFDGQAPKLAAELFRPGCQTEAARVREHIAVAARVLAQQLRDSGLHVEAMEADMAGAALGTTLSGRADMVLGPRPAVVDLKWAGTAYHRTLIGQGAAYQLAAYANLQSQGRSHSHVQNHSQDQSTGSSCSAVAYFIVAEQRLLTSDSVVFPRAEHIAGPTWGETWAGFSNTHRAVWERAASGELEARLPTSDKDLDKKNNRLVDGCLQLVPPCRFCEYGGLCGLTLPEGSS